MTGGMPTSDMEAVWEALAGGLDRAGPEAETLFLSKLALLLADALGDRAGVEHLIEAALRDLT